MPSSNTTWRRSHWLAPQDKGPGCLRYIGDEILPSYVGITLKIGPSQKERIVFLPSNVHVRAVNFREEFHHRFFMIFHGRNVRKTGMYFLTLKCFHGHFWGDTSLRYTTIWGEPPSLYLAKYRLKSEDFLW